MARPFGAFAQRYLLHRTTCAAGPATAIPSRAFSGHRVPTGTTWLVVARGAVVGLLSLWYWPGYTELRRPAPARPADWVLGMAGGIAVFLAWLAYLLRIT